MRASRLHTVAHIDIETEQQDQSHHKTIVRLMLSCLPIYRPCQFPLTPPHRASVREAYARPS